MHDELKAAAYEANMLLPEYGLISLTFGNASVVDRAAGILAIKPSGVGYDILRPEDMVLVDLDGNKVAGALNPSSDTATHACLYRAFPQIGAVVHTHSKFATSYAQAGLEISCYGTTHADYCCESIPVTRPMRVEEIQGAYELETGNVIVERFAGHNPGDYPGVLVHGHAPFAWGPNGNEAAENAFALELVAEMAFYTRQLNPAIGPLTKALHHKHFYRKHGKDAYYGQG
jgi:L-ribulose-5-phosphate 4-epimerase